MTVKRIQIYLFGIFILSLLLNALNAFYFNPILDPDSIIYIKMAEYLSNGHIKQACYLRPEVPMLYQCILSLGIKAGISPELFGKLLSIICGAALSYLMFYITKFFMNDKFALASSLLFTCNPLLINSHAAVLRDTFLLLLMSLSLFFLLSALNRFNIYKYTAAGFFAGLCAQTRVSSLALVVFIPLYIFFSYVFYREYDSIYTQGYLFLAIPARRLELRGSCKNSKTNLLMVYLHRNIIWGFLIFIVIFFAVTMPIQYYFVNHGSNYTIFLTDNLLKLYLL